MDNFYTDNSNDRPYSSKKVEVINANKEEKKEKEGSHDYNYWIRKYKTLSQN